MIVDDAHGLVAVVSSEAHRSGISGTPLYLDARIPAIMHLRLLSALYKPTTGRLSRLLHEGVEDGQQSALLAALTTPRPKALRVLDDRTEAGAISRMTTEPGVSLAFAAMIAHAHTLGQPIVIDPRNEGRWQDAADSRHVEVVVRPARIGTT